MNSSRDEYGWLRDRAQQVGNVIGRRIEFDVMPTGYACLLVDNIVILGPEKGDLIVHDADVTLTALESGTQVVVDDEDGTPRLAAPLE